MSVAETFKPVKGFEEAEVSNLGRVRGILPLQAHAEGFFTVSLRETGSGRVKEVNVQQLVAELFTQSSPDPQPGTAAQPVAAEPKPVERKAAPFASHPVMVVDGDGEHEFKSINAAARSLGAHSGSVSNALKTGLPVPGTQALVMEIGQEYTSWFDELMGRSDRRHAVGPCARKRVEVSLHGKSIGTFNSINEASKKLGVDRRNIEANIAGKRVRAGGYTFKLGD